MWVYDLKDEAGRTFAFEVSNSLLTRSGAVDIVLTIPGVKLRKAPTRFSGEDEFCAFEVDGQHFTICEPFGDNSRYWIGPTPPSWCQQVAIVRDAFERYKTISLAHFLGFFG